MKKRFLSVLLTITLALCSISFTGCGSQKEEAAKKEESQDLLEEIKERGKIIIATEGTWAPWTYHDENDELVGFDVEVAKAIAEKLGVKAEFVEVEWDGIFAGIDAKRYDITCNGVEVDEERAEKYNFTDPYAYMRTAVIVREDDDRISSLND